MDDGQVIALDLSEAELIGGEKETQRGRWPEFSERWLRAALPDYRPGPHVPLTLEIRGVRSGALVAVRGTLSRRGSSRSKGSSNPQAEVEGTGRPARRAAPTRPSGRANTRLGIDGMRRRTPGGVRPCVVHGVGGVRRRCPRVGGGCACGTRRNLGVASVLSVLRGRRLAGDRPLRR